MNRKLTWSFLAIRDHARDTTKSPSIVLAVNKIKAQLALEISQKSEASFGKVFQNN